MSGVSYNGEMYMFGGYDKDSEPCNDCYKFNLGTFESGEREEEVRQIEWLIIIYRKERMEQNRTHWQRPSS